MFSLRIAWRYLFTKRENSSTKHIIIVAIAATAIGVAMPMMVLSIIHGFHDTIRSGIISRDFHIKVKTEGLDINKINEIRDQITTISLHNPEDESNARKDYIAYAAPYIESQALVEKNNTKATMFRGFEQKMFKNPKLLKYFRCTSGCVEVEKNNKPVLDENDEPLLGYKIDQPGAIVLGEDLAGALFLHSLNKTKEMIDNGEMGTVIRVLSPKYDNDGNPIINPRHFKVVGTFKTGFREIDGAFALMDINNAIKATGNDVYTGIGVELIDQRAASQIELKIDELLQKQYPDFNEYQIAKRTKTFEDANKNFLYALDWELTWVRVVMVIMILASYLTVALTLYVVVTDKRKEIGILKAMGVSWLKVGGIFVSAGLIITLTGMLLGLIVGAIAIPPLLTGIVSSVEYSVDELRQAIANLGYASVFGLELPLEPYTLIDSAIFQTDGVPFEVHWQDFFRIVFLTLVVGFLFALLPALMASRMRPIDVIRQE